MSRRGANIYKRKDGRWEGRIAEEGGMGGVRKYSSVYGKNYNEVKAKLDLLKGTRKPEGEPVKGSLGDVMDTWLKEKEPSWKKTTYGAYSQIVYKYIVPKIGGVRADRVDGQALELLAESIRQDTGGLVSDQYLRSICGIVLRALKYIKKKYRYAIEVPENLFMPSRRSRAALPKQQDLAVLERYLLEHAWDGTCLGILAAFYTGIRIGEACALTWGDVGLEEGVIYVRRNLQRVKTPGGAAREAPGELSGEMWGKLSGETPEETKNGADVLQQSRKTNTKILRQEPGRSTEILVQTPKTSTSFRAIPIPPVLAPLLNQYHGAEGEYVIKGRKKAWVEPRTLQYRFAKILAACGIDGFNFHMLRHAFATRCIDKGFDVKSLSEILGHSSVQVTLNLYVHSSMQRKKELMGKFNICYHQDYAEGMEPDKL